MEILKVGFSRKLVSTIFIISLFLILNSPAAAVNVFIPAPDRVDMVYDSGRETLYITSGSSILRYHTPSDSFLTPIQLSGSLSGIDLSPDGDKLLVADRDGYSDDYIWAHEVDLNTGLSQTVMAERAFYEGGTYTVAYGNDGAALITSRFLGSGWTPMRKYNPTAGTVTELASVRQNTMLCASADGSIIGFEESSASDGPFGRYRVSDGDILRKSGYDDGTSWFNYEIGVNRDGTQFAIPTYGGAFIYDENLEKVTQIGQYAVGQPIGAVYSPTEDIVFFPWATSTKIKVFDSSTFLEICELEFSNYFDHPGNHAFVEGRLKMSDDGLFLFATVDGGIRFQDVGAIPEPTTFMLLGTGIFSLIAVARRPSKPIYTTKQQPSS